MVYPHDRLVKSFVFIYVHLYVVSRWSTVLQNDSHSLRRRRTDILDVGESTLDVGEQTVGETTRRRNDRKPL